jgi:hypothetical protein
VPNDTNFFWATFFILHDPLELSTGACPTPSGTEIVETHHCEVVWNEVSLSAIPRIFFQPAKFDNFKDEKKSE